MKLTNLPEEGVLSLVAGVLGLIALLVMFGCAAGGSSMSCDSLLADEKDACLEEVRIRDSNIRYQMETSGSVR